MANISFARLYCVTFVATQTGGRVFNYDGSSANINGNTDVLTMELARTKATWDTAVNSTFRVGDLILVSCTNGTQVLSVVNIAEGGVPVMSLVTETLLI